MNNFVSFIVVSVGGNREMSGNLKISQGKK